MTKLEKLNKTTIIILVKCCVRISNLEEFTIRVSEPNRMRNSPNAGINFSCLKSFESSSAPADTIPCPLLLIRPNVNSVAMYFHFSALNYSFKVFKSIWLKPALALLLRFGLFTSFSFSLMLALMFKASSFVVILILILINNS